MFEDMPKLVRTTLEDALPTVRGAPLRKIRTDLRLQLGNPAEHSPLLGNAAKRIAHNAGGGQHT
jgi:hypothetical protein